MMDALSLFAAGEFCHGEAFTASCSIDEVIVMRTAAYGRMRIGRCVKTGYSQVGCRANVMRQADRICSGRRSCRIQVTSRSFGNVQPCTTDAKSYFEVAYDCKKGWLCDNWQGLFHALRFDRFCFLCMLRNCVPVSLCNYVPFDRFVCSTVPICSCSSVFLFHLISVPICFCSTLLLPTVVLFHCMSVRCLSVPLYFRSALCLFRCISVSVYFCSAVSLRRCVSVPLYFCSTVFLFRCMPVPLYLCSSVFPFQCISVQCISVFYVPLYFCSAVFLFQCISISVYFFLLVIIYLLFAIYNTILIFPPPPHPKSRSAHTTKTSKVPSSWV